MKTFLSLFTFLLFFNFDLFSSDHLPSWNDGKSKQAILDFVRDTTDPTKQSFVKPENRIATFDQDGTLWVEHPLYTQGVFALERVKALAASHPEWKNQEPFKAIIEGNSDKMTGFTEQDWAEIIAATHTGMSTESFELIVKKWISEAKHPRFNRLYTELVYQPMLEVIRYLQANDYKIFIVTGGGQEFVRVYSQPTYGISVDQIAGSSVATKYENQNGKPILMRLPKLFFMDNFAGKAIGINLFIGKRPYAAFGNSEGDREMLEWTQGGGGAKLMMLVLHDDPEREYAYGPAEGLPDTDVGKFPQSLMDEADKRGWNIISMKKDWKQIFSFEKNEPDVPIGEKQSPKSI